MAAWARGRSRRRGPADPLLALALPRAHRGGTRVERARPRSVSAAVRPGQALRVLITPGGGGALRENGRSLPSHLPTGPSVAAARAPPRPPSELLAGDEEPRGARRGGGKRGFRSEPSSLTCLRQGRRRLSFRPEGVQPVLSGPG